MVEISCSRCRTLLGLLERERLLTDDAGSCGERMGDIPGDGPVPLLEVIEGDVG